MGWLQRVALVRATQIPGGILTRALPGAAGHLGARRWSGQPGDATQPIADATQLDAEYRSLVTSGSIRADDSQLAAVRRLAELHAQLVASPRPPTAPQSQDTAGTAVEAGGSSSEQGSPHAPVAPPRLQGVYLWGPVGSGKSMLMDLFFNSSSLPKRRVHFHEFMVGIHKRLHELQQGQRRVVRASVDGLPVFQYMPTSEAHPLQTVANEMRTSVRLLCLDEMQVTDVADAMVLRKLFEELLRHGTMVAFTSNQPPDALYQGGLSRKYFLPFVELLHSRCDVLHVGSGTDYRTLPRRPDSAASLTALATATDRPAAAAVGAYFVGDDATLQLLRAWRELTGEVGAPTATKSVAAEFNRRLQVRHGSTADTAQAAAFVTFDELCARQANGHAHAASDFWALACAFPVVCLAQVPQLRPRQQRDEARRLVVLIDALYEARCRLFVAAAVPPSHVFAKLLEADTAARSARGEVCGGGGSGRPASSDEQRESLLTAEEKLMFRRAVSRLGELCGDIRSTA